MHKTIFGLGKNLLFKYILGRCEQCFFMLVVQISLWLLIISFRIELNKWKKSCTTRAWTNKHLNNLKILPSWLNLWGTEPWTMYLGSIVEFDNKISTGFYYFEMQEWKRPDMFTYDQKKKDKENKSQVLTHYTSSIWGFSCLFSRACVQQCVMLWKQPFWSQQRCLRWPPWPPPGGRPQSPGARLRIPCGAAQLGQMAKTHQKYIFKRSRFWRDYSDHYACNSLKFYR